MSSVSPTDPSGACGDRRADCGGVPLARGVVHRGLIEPAKAVEHRRLAQLSVMAAQCFAAGRIDDAIGYAETGLVAIESGRFDQDPYKFEASLGGPCITIGPPERWVELCRNMIAR